MWNYLSEAILKKMKSTNSEVNPLAGMIKEIEKELVEERIGGH